MVAAIVSRTAAFSRWPKFLTFMWIAVFAITVRYHRFPVEELGWPAVNLDPVVFSPTISAIT